jgi:hypothetical protein
LAVVSCFVRFLIVFKLVEFFFEQLEECFFLFGSKTLFVFSNNGRETLCPSWINAVENLIEGLGVRNSIGAELGGFGFFQYGSVALTVGMEVTFPNFLGVSSQVTLFLKPIFPFFWSLNLAVVSCFVLFLIVFELVELFFELLQESCSRLRTEGLFVLSYN